jgi:hypothetical protein
MLSFSCPSVTADGCVTTGKAAVELVFKKVHNPAQSIQ